MKQVWIFGLKDFNDLEFYIENRIQVLYAGVVAEAMDVDGNYDNEYALKEWKMGGGMIDHAKIRELIHVLRGMRHPNTIVEETAQTELNSIDSDLFQKACLIVSTRIETIYALGDALFKKIEKFEGTYEITENEINKVKQIKKMYIR